MHPAFFSLTLIALHVFAPVNCAPGLRGRELPPQHQQGTHTHTSAAARHAHPNGSVRQGRNLLAILPKRTATNKFVSIFDLRRKRFLCMDFKGELYNSRQGDRDNCLFVRLRLADHQEVFYSASSRRLLNPGPEELRWAQREPPERPPAYMETLMIPLIKRKRRSEEVNPSDPLRTESHPSLSVKDAEQPEQEQTGAVSKETIASCDDPLRVLRPNAPGSPIQDRATLQEKTRKQAGQD